METSLQNLILSFKRIVSTILICLCKEKIAINFISRNKRCICRRPHYHPLVLSDVMKTIPAQRGHSSIFIYVVCTSIDGMWGWHYEEKLQRQYHSFLPKIQTLFKGWTVLPTIIASIRYKWNIKITKFVKWRFIKALVQFINMTY